MKKILFVLVLILISNRLLAAVAHDMPTMSDSSSTNTLTLEELLTWVKQNNPEIQATRLAMESAKANEDASGTWSNPELGLELMYTPSNKFISESDEKNWTIKQDFKLPAVYALQKHSAQVQSQIRQAEYQQKVNDILTEARKAYSMYNHAFHVLSFYQENIANMKRFAKVAEGKYIAGQATQGDVLKAQVELTRMLNMQIEIQQEQETALAMLNSLMGRPTENPLPQPQYPAWHKLNKTYAELLTTALTQKPELISASLNVQLADLARQQVGNDYWPEGMAEYRNRNSVLNGQSYDLMLGVTLPLWRKSLDATARSAAAEKAMKQAEYTAQQNTLAYDIKKQLVRVQSNERFVDLYDNSVLPQAQQALQVTEASYQSGKSSFLDLLDAERLVLQARQEYHQYLDEHEQALAELEKTVGGPL